MLNKKLNILEIEKSELISELVIKKTYTEILEKRCKEKNKNPEGDRGIYIKGINSEFEYSIGKGNIDNSIIERLEKKIEILEKVNDFINFTYNIAFK